MKIYWNFDNQVLIQFFLIRKKMVNLCCILNCPSQKYSLFSIPKDEKISNKWKQAISNVNGKPASLASHV